MLAYTCQVVPLYTKSTLTSLISSTKFSATFSIVLVPRNTVKLFVAQLLPSAIEIIVPATGEAGSVILNAPPAVLATIASKFTAV